MVANGVLSVTVTRQFSVKAVHSSGYDDIEHCDQRKDKFLATVRRAYSQGIKLCFQSLGINCKRLQSNFVDARRNTLPWIGSRRSHRCNGCFLDFMMRLWNSDETLKEMFRTSTGSRVGDRAKRLEVFHTIGVPLADDKPSGASKLASLLRHAHGDWRNHLASRSCWG